MTRYWKVRGARLAVGLGCALGALGATSPAHALQPLSEFLAHADDKNPDNREAQANFDQSDAQAQVALGRLLPVLSARGVYTRNQVAASFNFPAMGTTPAASLVISPLNQLDGYLQLDVPLVDLASYSRYKSQKISADASREQANSTKFEIQKQVVRAYFQLFGSTGVVAAAGKSLDVAQRNGKVVQDRLGGGLASDLDVQRAAADVERARQDLADAGLLDALAQRNLASLTGIVPSPTGPLPPDDLHEEASLASWLAKPGTELPSGKVAVAQARAADEIRSSARLALAPTLTASAQEHFTNATALLGGRTSFFAATATLSWRLDYGTIATLRAQDAAAEAARARSDGTARRAEDQVYEAWQRVRAGIVKSQAARAQVAATARAVQAANDRYLSGIATQLDVIQAQRDAFGAEVTAVQADADLGAARAVLRLSGGRPIVDSRTGGTSEK
jgi:outer membrane protein TolC